MEMLSSFVGDRDEFCLMSLSLSMFTVVQALISLIHDCIE